jgi:hypothetical protein
VRSQLAHEASGAHTPANVERNRESLSFAGTDPVAGWERWLEVVVAPTGEAARFKAATEGSGSAWLSRTEVVALIGFFEEWLSRTERAE